MQQLPSVPAKKSRCCGRSQRNKPVPPGASTVTSPQRRSCTGRLHRALLFLLLVAALAVAAAIVLHSSAWERPPPAAARPSAAARELLTEQADSSLLLADPPRLPPPDGASDWLRAHALFFLHVPKTAGLSFSRTLYALLRPYQRLLPIVRTPYPPRLDLAFMGQAATTALVTPQQRLNFSYRYGPHVATAGHTDVLIAAAYSRIGRELLFLTLLRRPVDRVWSHFCYVLRPVLGRPGERTHQSLHKLHGETFPSWLRWLNSSRDPPLSAASFSRFVSLSVADRVDNWQTRAAAGCLHTAVLPASDQPGVCDDGRAMLLEAKRRLSSFLFVGLTDQSNASIALLKQALHYDPTRYAYDRNRRPAHAPGGSAEDGMADVGREMNVNAAKLNCTGAVTQDAAEKAELDGAVAEVERLDLQLYDFASRLVRKRLAGLPARVQ